MLQEKQQLAKELSDMERSFSDVVKRLDRRKEVIDGFKKVRSSRLHFKCTCTVIMAGVLHLFTDVTFGITNGQCRTLF